MAFLASQGVVLTIGFASDTNRWACVIPMVADAAIMSAEDVVSDFNDWVPGTLIDAWVACLAVDTYVAGWSLQAMAGVGIYPIRQVYSPETFRGTVAGDSTPPQTSMVLAFYNENQVNLPSRTSVAKSFVGPGPESKWDSGILTDAVHTAHLFALGAAMKDFVGGTTVLHWFRAMRRSSTPTEELFEAQNVQVRTSLYTQRRRATPVF